MRNVVSYREKIEDSSMPVSFVSSESSWLSEHSLSPPMEVSEVVQHKCAFCMKEFSLKCKLNRHRCKNMIIQPSYPCDQCKNVYNRIDRLKAHQRSKHNQIPAVTQTCHKCDICDIKFTRLWNLNRHLDVKHNNQRQKPEHRNTKHHMEVMTVKTELISKKSSSYLCIQCNKSFSSRYNMKMHVQIVHDRIKQFKCPSCPKSFGLKAVLNKHIKAIHCMQDDISKFTCKICRLKIFQKSNLTTHLKIHDANSKLFKCMVCTQTYTRKAALDKHSCPYN